jgi:hypothetical protein
VQFVDYRGGARVWWAATGYNRCIGPRLRAGLPNGFEASIVMANAEYEQDLARLRKDYVEATPRQRYSVARQRIEHPGHGPNVLVACVAAVEGLARSLAMHREASRDVESPGLKAQLSAIYPKYKRKNPEELIAQYLLDRGLAAPPDFFGTETWERFHYAIEYRNVLAHECTYLGQDRSPALIEACEAVLHRLAASAGLKVLPP